MCVCVKVVYEYNRRILRIQPPKELRLKQLKITIDLPPKIQDTGQIESESEDSNSVPSFAGGQERDVESYHSRTSQEEYNRNSYKCARILAVRADARVQNPACDEKAAKTPCVHAANSPNRNVS